jgi:hypothetical protein
MYGVSKKVIGKRRGKNEKEKARPEPDVDRKQKQTRRPSLLFSNN